MKILTKLLLFVTIFCAVGAVSEGFNFKINTKAYTDHTLTSTFFVLGTLIFGVIFLAFYLNEKQGHKKKVTK